MCVESFSHNPIWGSLLKPSSYYFISLEWHTYNYMTSYKDRPLLKLNTWWNNGKYILRRCPPIAKKMVDLKTPNIYIVAQREQCVEEKQSVVRYQKARLQALIGSFSDWLWNNKTGAAKYEIPNIPRQMCYACSRLLPCLRNIQGKQ